MTFAHVTPRFIVLVVMFFAALLWGAFADDTPPASAPGAWVSEWPNTDFTRTSIAYGEIQSGGPSKDGIPAIDHPTFRPIRDVSDIPDTEPAIVLTVNGETKVYPLRILTWHEIVNDTIGGVPVVVTYCPLCNAGIVFDARLKGRVLTFGTTGKLRNSDLVMYDRQTESWWQQFSGEGIVGESTGQVLRILPSRMEAFGRARERAPQALVLAPESGSQRPYGQNPYVGYDTAKQPFLYVGELPKDVEPMMRVIVVDGQAWALPLVRKKGRIDYGDLIIEWAAGQNSALDARSIAHGRDVGNVTVKRKGAGDLSDVVHHVTFAFVFHAFHPDGKIFKE